MEKTHTPLPWMTRKSYGGDGCIITHADKAPNEAHITDTSNDEVFISKEDAEFIVRACNSHYELLAALKEAEADVLDNGGYKEDYEPLVQLRAAIAKAEGE